MLDEAQLIERLSGVGGSDAPAIVGCDDYRQPLDVYFEKIGETKPDNDLEDRVEAVRWGNLLEDAIAKEWAHRQGVQVLEVGGSFAHFEIHFMRSNLDRVVCDVSEGLEVKARGSFAAEDYGPSGSDQVKDSDIIQCQHYMACTGWDLWHMAVLIGGQEMRSYKIPRDDHLIDNLVDIETDFWAAVQERTPPPLDFAHRSTPDLIKKMFPGTNGETVILEERAVEIAREIEQFSKERNFYKDAIKALQNERNLLLGENAVGVLPDGSGGWSRRKIERDGYEVNPCAYMGVYFSKKHKVA